MPCGSSRVELLNDQDQESTHVRRGRDCGQEKADRKRKGGFESGGAELGHVVSRTSVGAGRSMCVGEADRTSGRARQGRQGSRSGCEAPSACASIAQGSPADFSRSTPPRFDELGASPTDRIHRTRADRVRHDPTNFVSNAIGRRRPVRSSPDRGGVDLLESGRRPRPERERLADRRRIEAGSSVDRGGVDPAEFTLVAGVARIEAGSIC